MAGVIESIDARLETIFVSPDEFKQSTKERVDEGKRFWLEYVISRRLSGPSKVDLAGLKGISDLVNEYLADGKNKGTVLGALGANADFINHPSAPLFFYSLAEDNTFFLNKSASENFLTGIFYFSIADYKTKVGEYELKFDELRENSKRINIYGKFDVNSLGTNKLKEIYVQEELKDPLYFELSQIKGKISEGGIISYSNLQKLIESAKEDHNKPDTEKKQGIIQALNILKQNAELIEGHNFSDIKPEEIIINIETRPFDEAEYEKKLKNDSIKVIRADFGIYDWDICGNRTTLRKRGDYEIFSRLAKYLIKE